MPVAAPLAQHQLKTKQQYQPPQPTPYLPLQHSQPPPFQPNNFLPINNSCPAYCPSPKLPVGAADPVESMDGGAGQYLPLHHSPSPALTPLGLPSPHPTPLVQTPVYWMPTVNVPYASSIGQVNMACPPSQDPFGKDLPLQDVNTMRFFFNVGVEQYCRTVGSLQQPPPGGMPTPMYQPGLMLPSEECPMEPPLQPPYMDLGQSARPTGSVLSSSSTVPPSSSSSSSFATTSLTTTTSTPAAKGEARPGSARECVAKVCSVAGGAKAVTEAAQGDSEMDKDGDDETNSTGASTDSGCPSDCCLGGERKKGKGCDDAMVETGTSGEGEVQETGKSGGKGKRKYYMYGNHKLIKPIKDIPARFQQLLAESSAARARCEGQPIYLAAPPDSGDHCGDGGMAALNVNAHCFVPGQTFPRVEPGDRSAPSTACPTPQSGPPPPSFVMPPPPTPGSVTPLQHSTPCPSSSACQSSVQFSAACSAMNSASIPPGHVYVTANPAHSSNPSVGGGSACCYMFASSSPAGYAQHYGSGPPPPPPPHQGQVIYVVNNSYQPQGVCPGYPPMSSYQPPFPVAVPCSSATQ